MGETAPLETLGGCSHARRALQRKTRSVGRAARGEGEPQIPIKPPINPNVRVCPIQKAESIQYPSPAWRYSPSSGGWTKHVAIVLAIKHSSVLVGLVPGKYASKHAPTAARPASSQQKRARSPYAQHSLPPVSIVPRGRTDVQNCLTGERTTPDDESSIHASPHPLIMIRCQCGYGRNP